MAADAVWRGGSPATFARNGFGDDELDFHSAWAEIRPPRGIRIPGSDFQAPLAAEHSADSLSARDAVPARHLRLVRPTRLSDLSKKETPF